MKQFYRTFLVFSTIFLLFSCKQDVKETSTSEAIKTDTLVKKERVTPTQEDKDRANSVLTKLMVTPESKKFTNYLVTAQMTDDLMKKKGPYTVFAPSAEALDGLSEETRQDFMKPENKEALATMLRQHIVEGGLDSATLVQKIRENNGSLVLTTIGGTQLTASRSGSDIVITHSNGTKAIVGKSDIQGSNGVLHIVDAAFIQN